MDGVVQSKRLQCVAAPTWYHCMRGLEPDPANGCNQRSSILQLTRIA